MNISSKRFDPQRPKKPSATTRTVKVKEVGTSPVRNNLCIPPVALSVAVQNKVTESGQPAEETGSQRTRSKSSSIL